MSCSRWAEQAMLNRGLYRKSLSARRSSCVSGSKQVACAVPQWASHRLVSGSHPEQSIWMVDKVALGQIRFFLPDRIVPKKVRNYLSSGAHMTKRNVMTVSPHHKNISYMHIQGVPGGTDKTSEGCSLC